jgi:hypothetical protein
LPTGAEALDEPLAAFPSWFLRIKALLGLGHIARYAAAGRRPLAVLPSSLSLSGTSMADRDLPARIGSCEFGMLGGMIAVRCPRDLVPMTRADCGALGAGEPALADRAPADRTGPSRAPARHQSAVPAGGDGPGRTLTIYFLCCFGIEDDSHGRHQLRGR